MGEGEGGGGQDEDLLGPPSPSSPPTEGRGDFVGIYLFNYGFLSNLDVSLERGWVYFQTYEAFYPVTAYPTEASDRPRELSLDPSATRARLFHSATGIQLVDTFHLPGHSV